MNLYSNELYMDDLRYVCSASLPWEKMRNKSIMLSGATGLIGSVFIDVLCEKNASDNLNCMVYALVRNQQKARKRFSKYISNKSLLFIPYDVKFPLTCDNLGKIDFVLHLASNTHPIQYSTDPIGTITTNIIGLQNMLDFAVNHKATRFAFASSNEIYGENRGDAELFDENYCGYINSNTMRAGYPESKRCGEALCQAYKVQKGLDIVVPRFTRSYGPSMLMSDTKAVSQFIKKAVSGENIVLKSQGLQYYSYTYVFDAVYGLFTVLLKGENGDAYNIADESSDIMLKDLAKIIASLGQQKVIFEVPDDVEAAGYSKATKARLDGSKIKSLGWSPKYDINNGIVRTIDILKNIGLEDEMNE
jgi:eps4I